MRKPPRLALALLERIVRGRAREEIEGDLLEEFESRRRSRLWFWRESVGVAWAYWRAEKKRGRRRWRPREGLLEDLRVSVRVLLRRRGFSAAVLALLVVACGANAAMFYLADGIWNRRLPYAEAHRLVRLFHTRNGVRESLSPPNYFDLVERQQVFDALAAYWSPRLTLTGEGEPERLLAATVSHAFFDVLGAPPRLGRGFSIEDDQPGAPAVVVLAHGLFERRFGGNPGVIGREILLDGIPAEVVGVAREDFRFPVAGTELWVPLRLPRDRSDQGGTPYRSFRILDVVGRRKAGVSLEEARASLASVSESLAREYPGSNRDFRLEVEDLKEVELAPIRAPLLLLWSAVILLFLIVSANLSGLWIARLAARERELAIRLALGSSRARLSRELCGEGLILAFVGVALGCLVGRSVVGIIHAWGFDFLVRPDEIAAGVRLVGFGTAMFAVVALAFLVAPVLVRPGGGIADSLRAGGRLQGGRAQAGARRVLVVFEMALAATLLVSAMLLLKSFHALSGVERGFREEGVYYASIELPHRKYRENHRRASFFRELQERVRHGRGIERAGISLGLPLDPRADFFVTRSPFSVEGKPEAPAGLKPEAALHVVGPDLFETLGISILAGRGFDARDAEESPPVLIVNRSFAESAWPGEDPLGKEVIPDLSLLPDLRSEPRRVVGVVSDFRYYALERDPEPQMYLPHAQSPWPAMHLLVRASADPAALHAELREILRDMDEEVPLAPFRELSSVTEAVISPARVRARLLASFAVAAAVLAALALYGVMAFTVSRRTREIGVRVALGARRAEVLKLVFGEALKLALSGALLGLGGALLSVNLLSSLLFGVEALDPWSYGAMFLALVALALVAGYVPARRAAAIDPIQALRAD